MQPKVSINPRLQSRVGTGIPVENATGSVSFASFRRIIEGMKKGGEMPTDWNVIGINIEPDGVAFILGPRKLVY